MEQLEFAAHCGRLHFPQRRDRERVVGCELAVDRRSVRKQAARAGEVGQVRGRLAREDRVVGEAPFLRALDLGIPVRALDQSGRDPPPAVGRDRGKPLDDRQRATAVGLHRQAEARPVARPGVACDGFEHVERKVEAIGLLCIDRQADAMGRGEARKFRHAHAQPAEDPLPLQQAEARLERRQLHRDSVTRVHLHSVRRRAKVRDAVCVGREVAFGFRRGPRAFAQHVERAERESRLASRASCRGFDVGSDDELAAQHRDRAPQRRAHRRLAGAPQQGSQPVAVRCRIRVDHSACEFQGPGRGMDQHRPL